MGVASMPGVLETSVLYATLRLLAIVRGPLEKIPHRLLGTRRADGRPNLDFLSVKILQLFFQTIGVNFHGQPIREFGTALPSLYTIDATVADQFNLHLFGPSDNLIIL